MTPKMTQKNYEAIKIYNQKEKIFELKGQIQTLRKQLEIAKEVIRAVLCDEFIMEHADAGLIMYITDAHQRIKELEK
jgi:hypothetical protein